MSHATSTVEAALRHTLIDELDVKEPVLSLIVPVYNEQESIQFLYEEIVSVCEEAEEVFEIIFVDDGSSDTSLAVIQELQERDSRVRGISLLKNSHKGGALLVGFREAQGDIVITLDADLQDDPHEIPRFTTLIRSGSDHVNGWKRYRRDSLRKRALSFVMNSISSFLLDAKFHDMNCGLKAYRSDVAKQLVIKGSMYRFIPHVLHAQGYKVTEIEVNHRPRKFGQSKFGLFHRLRGPFDLITLVFLQKFGERPLHLFGWVGCTVIVAGLALTPVQTTLSVLLIIVGIQFISIGLIGELVISRSEPHRIPAYKSVE